jgi:6-pyruvoyltetrahydropterin/6-carboxytetrahydropterin synthase
MKFRLSKTFKFDAAHRLIDYDGSFANLHGHTYKLVVTVEGVPDETGMVIDLFDLKKIVNDKIVSKMDHHYLNDLYEQPTVENMAKDIFLKLEKEFEKTKVKLFSIKLYEGEGSYIEVFS